MATQLSTPTTAPTAPTSPRRGALIAGAALALMAVIAPIANFGLIPAGQTGPAAALLATVFVLDVVAALALVPVLREAGPRLAQLAAALRILLYAAAFVVAVAQLAAGGVEAFQSIWDAALAVFGLHLLLVATLFVRGRELPSWVGILVGIAGVGYLVDAALVVGNSQAAIGQFTFVGEVVLLVWLLGWGGRRRARG